VLPLTASPAAVFLGPVEKGASRSAALKLTNIGTSPVRISGVAGPVAPFSASGLPAAGAVLAAGQSALATVTFAPLVLGTYSDQISVSTAAGTLVVALSADAIPPGTGVPDPALGGWQLNGSAKLVSGALQLTPAAPGQVGSAFWPKAVPSANLIAEFDVTMADGDPASGGDGVALVLADPATGATALSLGGGGGGLGAVGIPGICVGLSTYPTSQVGIANNGTDPTQAWLSYMVQTATGVPDLRSATRHVKVAVSTGIVTVSVNGAQIVSLAVALPARILVGFSGATGPYLFDRYAITNAMIAAP
jgi:hypothetical protein